MKCNNHFKLITPTLPVFIASQIRLQGFKTKHNSLKLFFTSQYASILEKTAASRKWKIPPKC